MSDRKIEIKVVTEFTGDSTSVVASVVPRDAPQDDVILSLAAVFVNKIIDMYPDSSVQSVVGLASDSVEKIYKIRKEIKDAQSRVRV